MTWVVFGVAVGRGDHMTDVVLLLEVARGAGVARVEDVDEVAEGVTDGAETRRPPGRSRDRCMRMTATAVSRTMPTAAPPITRSVVTPPQ